MDTIGQFLTKIRNASEAKHPKVDIPSSNMRKGIAEILKAEGFIKDFKVVTDNKQGMMRIYLKYTSKGEPVINTLRRVSRPGRRYYVGSDRVEKVRTGFGVTVLSTNKGIISGAQAEQMKVGGEYLLKVW
jgi:small subunit ribosomal protein S8